MADEQVEKLAVRLGAVSEDQLRAELARRNFRLRSVAPSADSTAVGAPTVDSQPVKLSHFPDNVLIAAAKSRGIEVSTVTRSGLDLPKAEASRESSLLEALDDTYTRDQMETAYQEMLELRKRRRSKTQG